MAGGRPQGARAMAGSRPEQTHARLRGRRLEYLGGGGWYYGKGEIGFWMAAAGIWATNFARQYRTHRDAANSTVLFMATDSTML
jgi:hypothetical protein